MARPDPASPVALDEPTIERLAHRVAELLHDELPAPAIAPSEPVRDRRLVTAAQVADRWSIDRAWVYAHADDLGAHRLGTGTRPRLRFDPALVEQRLGPSDPPSQAGGSSRMRSDGRGSGRTFDESPDLLDFQADAELSSNDPNESRSGAKSAPPIGARRTARSTR
jgi:hypothetical protein